MKISLKFLSLILPAIFFAPVFLIAHAGHHHIKSIETTGDNTKQGKYFQVTLEKSPEAAIVGKLEQLSFVITQLKNKRPVKDIQAELSIELLEDKIEVIRMPLTISEWKATIGYDFMDGSEHHVSLHLWSESTHESEQFEWVVDVEALHPPRIAMLKSLIFLVLLLAAGMVIGIGLGKPKAA